MRERAWRGGAIDSPPVTRIERFELQEELAAGSSAEGKWITYREGRMAITPLVEKVHEGTGDSSYPADTIVWALWCPDSKRYEVLAAVAGASWVYFELTENMGATTTNEGAAKLLEDDMTDSGDTITLYDPVEMFSSLTSGTKGQCQLRADGKYHIIQAQCPV